MCDPDPIPVPKTDSTDDSGHGNPPPKRETPPGTDSAQPPAQ